MIDHEYVWYVGYGSNMSSQRFNYYITGGNPQSIDNEYEGCRDDSRPEEHKPAIINHELYFAKESSTWGNQGVAFVRPTANKEVETYARKYLIRREQLEDVAKQETGSECRIEIDYDAAIENGEKVYKRPSWYGLILHLGSDDGHPMFTITNEDIPDWNRPSKNYLEVIVDGLRETHDLSQEEIVEYLMDQKGIDGNYSREELHRCCEADHS